MNKLAARLQHTYYSCIDLVNYFSTIIFSMILDNKRKLFNCAASAQGGGPQARSLQRLGTTSNSNLVETSQCTTNSTPTNLFCPFTNSEELIVNNDTGVALQDVKFQICLCNSAMTFKYTLTNGTEIAHPCNQCPVQVPIDHLLLANDFTVFKDNFTVTHIAVLVSGWDRREGERERKRVRE